MLQILINGLISGLLLAIVALGFHVIYSTTKIFHIAHGGAYVASVFFYYWIHPLVGSFAGVILSLVFAFTLGLLMEGSVYKPLIKKSVNQNIALISSLGVYIIIVNIIALLFGNETIILNNTVSETFMIGEYIITKPQLTQIITAIPLIIIFLLLMNISGFGLKVKAIADNPMLARVVGIKIQSIRYIVFGIGSLMAASAALLKAYDTGIDPNSGMAITLSAVVVVIIGGTSSLTITVLASLLLAVLQNLTEYFLSAQWKDTVTFTILLIVLLWRTEGLMHFKIRTDEK